MGRCTIGKYMTRHPIKDETMIGALLHLMNGLMYPPWCQARWRGLASRRGIGTAQNTPTARRPSPSGLAPRRVHEPKTLEPPARMRQVRPGWRRSYSTVSPPVNNGADSSALTVKESLRVLVRLPFSFSAARRGNLWVTFGIDFGQSGLFRVTSEQPVFK